MPDRAYLHPIDPELVPGARNAIDVCLRLKREERITIVTDTVTREIAAALQREVERVGSDYSLFVLEHHARRPLAVHAGDNPRGSGMLAGLHSCCAEPSRASSARARK